MTFAQPHWFWAFAAFPVLVALFFQTERRRAQLLRKLVAARLQDRLAGTVSVAKRRFRFLLLQAGMAGVLVALAEPRYGETWEQSKRKGHDVLIAIDTSKSMLATDLAPNRLARAKLAAQDVIHQLAGDRVGLIAFAGTAFLQAPLTVDYGAVLGALNEVDTEVIPQGGTNIAAAIRTALEAFGKGEGDHRALIIFTDGEDLEAAGEKAAEEVKDVAKIFTVGLGSAEGSFIPRPGGRGGEFLKNEDGEIVKSRLDEERLRKIAEATGGFYVQLQNGRADTERIVRDGLGKMNEQDIDAKLSRHPIERYQWPLGAGSLLLAASMLIGERRRGIKAGGRLAVIAISAALYFPAEVRAKNSGVEAYEREDFKGALGQFSEQLKLQPKSPALQFDLGSAAYKSGDLDTALHAFSHAVTSSDPQLRAKAEYNLGNTLFQRGAAQKEKEPKIQEWKNALQHYDQTLKAEPQNQDAEFNRDVINKLIAELEKEPPKSDEKKKDEKKQDQKKDQKDEPKDQEKGGEQDQKDQEKKEQNSESKDQQGEQKDAKPQDGKEGEPKDQKGEKPGEKGDEKKPDQASGGSKGDDQKKDGKTGEQPEPSPAEPEKKREGELKPATPSDKPGEPTDAEQQAAEEVAAVEGKMTERQAKTLLDSLKSEDQRVPLTDPQARKGKARGFRDW